MFRFMPHLVGVLAGVVVWCTPTAATPQPEGRLQIEILGTDESVYLISGGGGNSVAVVDDESGQVVLIDTKSPGWGQAITDVVALVTDLPIVTLINTHAHADHTGSNGEFPLVTRVVAHEQAAAALASAGASGGPIERVGEKVSLLDGENRMDLYHFGVGHTDGDLIVVFPAKGLAYLGDLFPAKVMPVVDSGAGGSAIALAGTLGRMVDELPAVTKVVTGEMRARNQYADRSIPVPGAATYDWTDLEEYAAFCQELVTLVRAAHTTGETVEEAVNRVRSGLRRYDAYDLSGARTSVEAIYAELGG